MMVRAQAHDFASFRTTARTLLAQKRAPHEVSWEDPRATQADLFARQSAPLEAQADGDVNSVGPRVPRRFVEMAELAVLYRAQDRFELAYRVLFRLLHEQPRLLDDALDDDVRELTRRMQAVKRDEHRMHAFVRFRRTLLSDQETFVAWYAPDHLVLRLTAPFFERRFASQRWAIMTPDESAFWDGEKLSFADGVPRVAAPSGEVGEEQLEQLFRTYYRSTFNPARTNLKLFTHHVPEAFRRDMPELTELSSMVREARITPSTKESLPAVRTLPELANKLCDCQACPLSELGTRAVAGVGHPSARLCLVGEQPGDEEEKQGLPFVGPAGQVLDRALVQAGLQREQLYVTNAVKHFNYRPMGQKKRLHQTPRWEHISACRPWLQRELTLLSPQLVVCLGATAAQSFFGRRFSVSINRGRTFQTPWAPQVLVTYHPSAVLRAGDPSKADEVYAALVEDLTRARMLLAAA